LVQFWQGWGRGFKEGDIMGIGRAKDWINGGWIGGGKSRVRM